MPITKSLADGLLKTVGFLHPQYAPLIDFLEAHEDACLVAAGPVITEAAKEGPGALASGRAGGSRLGPRRNQAFYRIPFPHSDLSAKKWLKCNAENITRRIVGAPVLTEDQEQAWIDHASPISRRQSERERVSARSDCRALP